MTNRLDELRRLLDASTPGSWEAEPNPDNRGVVTWLLETDADDENQLASTLAEMCDRPDSLANLALIVFLRNHAEDLLAVAVKTARANEGRDVCLICDHITQRPSGPLEHEPDCALARLSPTSEEEVDE